MLNPEKFCLVSWDNVKYKMILCYLRITVIDEELFGLSRSPCPLGGGVLLLTSKLPLTNAIR